MIENYIALDLETTGLHPSEDRILEIGAVKVVNGEITDCYETLVNPGMAISPRIQALTGINDAMAATGKDTKTAVTELIDFCGDLPLLGHNILFDYSFVKKNAVNLGLTFEKDGVDTLKIARALLPDLELKTCPICAAITRLPRNGPIGPPMTPARPWSSTGGWRQNSRTVRKSFSRPDP